MQLLRDNLTVSVHVITFCVEYYNTMEAPKNIHVGKATFPCREVSSGLKYNIGTECLVRGRISLVGGPVHCLRLASCFLDTHTHTYLYVATVAVDCRESR